MTDAVSRFLTTRDRTIAFLAVLAGAAFLFAFGVVENFKLRGPLSLKKEDKVPGPCVIRQRVNISSRKNRPVVLPYSSDTLYASVVVEEQSFDVIVKIFYANRSNYYSVFAEVPGMYNIAARHVPNMSTHEALVYRLRLPSAVPPNTSAFKLSVFETATMKNGMTTGVSSLVDPSPFQIAVPYLNPNKIGKTGSALPPCQTSSDILLSDGVWRGPKDKLRSNKNARMRTGWNFEPLTCELEVFTQKDFEGLESAVTIVVLGSSIERGIFLTLVDMLTFGSEKIELANSKLAKCWGRAEVQLNGIKIVYQDMRAIRMRPDEEPNTVTCHGEHLAENSGMFNNATKMMKVLVHDLQPDVILTTSDCRHYGSQCSWTLKKLFEIAAPPSVWKGIWVVTGIIFNAMHPILGEDLFSMHRETLLELHERIDDKRVRFLDVAGLTAPMEFYAEIPGSVRRSQHFHGMCNDPGDELRICSNVTEAIAQLLLGIAVAPAGKMSMQKYKHIDDRPSERVIQCCYDCPASLLPFHIKPLPMLECTNGMRAANKTGDPFSSDCPAFCMATDPIGTAATQSGPVDVRTCNSLNNTAAHA